MFLRHLLALRHLSSYLLSKKIQTGSHCSEEDAIATLCLAVARARHGPSFRIREAADNRPSLLDTLSSSSRHRVLCLGPPDWVQKHATSTSADVLSCVSATDATVKATTVWACNPKKRSTLVWAHYRMNKLNGKGTGGVDAVLVSTPSVKCRCLCFLCRRERGGGRRHCPKGFRCFVYMRYSFLCTDCSFQCFRSSRRV